MMQRRCYLLWPAAWLVLMAAASARAAPQIACDEPVHDFEQAPTGGEIEHTFTLRNSGDEELVIREVKPACGCTAAELKTKRLAPGGSVDLPVTVSLKGRRGPLRKTIAVRSNDPERPTLTLAVKGTVETPIAASPSKLFFGHVRPGTTTTRSVDLAAAEGRTMRVEGVKVVTDRQGRGGSQDRDDQAAPEWSASLEPVVVGSAYRVSVELDAGQAVGRHEAVLQIDTDSEAVPTLRVPVSAVIAGELSSLPRTIELVAGSEKPLTRYVVIARDRSAEGAEPFEITDVTVPGEGIESRVRAVGNHGYRVRLSNLTADPGLDGQAVVIHTDVESMSQIEIPIRIEQPAEAEGGQS